MSLHDHLISRINRTIEALETTGSMSPTTIALAVHHGLTDEQIEAHIYYASMEHLKQMVRKVLAAKYEPNGSDNDAIQDELFVKLQDCYPVKRERGQEPLYKRRSMLSYEEAKWNVAKLRKNGHAFLEHSDGLDAWNEGRGLSELGIPA